MTQKELLYLEDAYKHEENLICYLDSLLEEVEEEELTKVIECETKEHESIKEKILDLMKEKAND